MIPTEETRQNASSRSDSGGRRGIAPSFPLLLLQTMRDMDRPEEILEDEDVTLSLPRRFGLSDVVGRHIYRLQEEVRRGRPQTVPEVENLIRLVVRRPDAEAIFFETGYRVAEEAWSSRAVAARRALQWLPKALATAGALRAVQRLLRHFVGDAQVRVQRRQLELQISGSLTARSDPGGTACAFYTGVFQHSLNRYTSRAHRVLHPSCEARGAETCEWRAEVT